MVPQLRPPSLMAYANRCGEQTLEGRLMAGCHGPPMTSVLFVNDCCAFMAAPIPSSADLARYLEARGELGKPWLWHLLRLSKLREAQHEMDPSDYVERLKEAHADLMRLGRFWEGREAEVFGGRYQPAQQIEPLPGSADDR